MAGVIGMACEDCKCPVQLLGEHHTRQSVRQRHRAQRKKKICAVSGLFRPPIGRPDREDQLLSSPIALAADPLRKGFRAHLTPSAVEQDEGGWSAAMLTLQGFKKGGFGLKSLDLGRRKGGNS